MTRKEGLSVNIMNVKRGLWRLWFVATILLMTAVFIQSYGLIQNEFAKQVTVDELLADGGLGVPVPCAEATSRQMGKEKLSWTSLSGTKSCYYPFSKVRKFWPEYADRPDIELMDELYSKAGDDLDVGQPVLMMLTIAALGMVLPLVALAFGWAIAGFTGVARKPTST